MGQRSSCAIAKGSGVVSVIEPFTFISGTVNIGDNCRVGPFAYLYEGADVPEGSVVGVFEKLKQASQ